MYFLSLIRSSGIKSSENRTIKMPHDIAVKAHAEINPSKGEDIEVKLVKYKCKYKYKYKSSNQLFFMYIESGKMHHLWKCDF